MVYLAILIIASVGLWLIINRAVSNTVNWKRGFRYWIIRCFGPPLLLSLFGMFRLINFVPQTTFDPSAPDLWAQNFLTAAAFGFIPATTYLLTAVTLSAITALRRAEP